MGFPDHFIVVTTLQGTRPRLETVMFESRNSKAIDINTFKSQLLASDVYNATKSGTNEFAAQLRDCVTEILHELAPKRRMTKRSGKPSNKWLSSEAIAARRTRHQLERRYHRMCSESAMLAFHAASRCTNHAIKASWRDFYAAKLVNVDGDTRGRWKLIRELLHTNERTAGKGAAESS